MRQELTAEVSAGIEAVWEALAGDLARRGEHVLVLEERAPAALRLAVYTGPGERLLLDYELARLDESNTAVHVAIEPRGVRYALKRLLSLGAVDRGYLETLAIGLQNLQEHLDRTDHDA